MSLRGGGGVYIGEQHDIERRIQKGSRGYSVLRQRVLYTRLFYAVRISI